MSRVTLVGMKEITGKEDLETVNGGADTMHGGKEIGLASVMARNVRLESDGSLPEKPDTGN